MKFQVLGAAVTIGLLSQISWADNTCSKDGGNYPCIPPTVGEWTKDYRWCSSVDYYNDSAFCMSLMGGKYDGWGNDGCHDYSPTTEDNIIARATNYATVWVNPIGSIIDSKWGIKETDTNACETPIPSPRKLNGITLNDGRNFNVFNTNNQQSLILTAVRTRKLTCPEGFQEVYDSTNQTMSCSFITKKLNCAASNDMVGNPCSITTGNKTLAETDWNSAVSALKVSRVYSSLTKDPQGPWLRL